MHLAQKHRESGSGIWDIREGYLSLITDTLDPEVCISDLRSRRDDLTNRLHKVYQGAPQTTGKAYSQAQDALKNKEDLTFSENEFDLLPPHPRFASFCAQDVRGQIQCGREREWRRRTLQETVVREARKWRKA
ncbi:SLATT domain-containing protein [Methylobacterium sp. D53M]